MSEVMREMFEKSMQDAQTVLDNSNIHGYCFQSDAGMPIMAVEIHWGDWKHDHMRAKYLIDKMGEWKAIASMETETDGSDCYSAIHYFMYMPSAS